MKSKKVVPKYKKGKSYIVHNNINIDLANLHVHSKNLSKYRPNTYNNYFLIMKYEFCGTPPLGFNYLPPNSENFVFVADPSFVPINLQNIFGSIVTVNSYYECFYYGELGWSVSTFNDFRYSNLFFVSSLAVYTFNFFLRIRNNPHLMIFIKKPNL